MKKMVIDKNKIDMMSKKPFEIEEYVLKMFKAVKSDNCTKGIDGFISNKGNLVPVEVKSHGLNRCSLGRVYLTKSLKQNIKDLLVSSLYFNVRPQENLVIIMTKAEMFDWLIDKVVLDKNRHGQPKFKINYFERSKRQDRKLIDAGFEI